MPASTRRGWVIAGVVALVLVVIGGGVGIWRYQDSGGSSTPNAAANEVPNPGPRPGDQEISIDQTWAVPAGTHVTVTWPGGGHCTKDEKKLSFDTGASPYHRVDVIFTRTTADTCRVQLSNARFVVKLSTGQTRDITVSQTSLVGLYQTQCESAGNLPCRGSGGATKTTAPVIAFG